MIDPAFLDELDRADASLELSSRERRQGRQRSSSVGEGLRFSDYRSYVPGDDTRLVDWKLYARTGERYVKQFEAERNLTVHALIDASGSMRVGEADRRKFDVAAKLGLGFAALAAAKHNDFRVSVFGESFDRIDRGGSNMGEVLSLIDRLNAVELDGEADFETALADYAATIDSRSLVLVASDFLADPATVEAGLDALSGNHLVTAQALSPRELDPPVSGDARFRGIERDEERRTFFGPRQRRSYRERLEDHVDAIADAARTVRARHARVETDEDFFDAFSRTWVE